MLDVVTLCADRASPAPDPVNSQPAGDLSDLEYLINRRTCANYNNEISKLNLGKGMTLSE